MQQTTISKNPSSVPVVVQVQPSSGLLTPGAQLTKQDVQALRVRLRDLRSELQDAAERRNSIAGRLKEADPAARAGYEGRLQALDNRIIGIENEITRVVQVMGTAPASAMVATTQAPDPGAIAASVASDIVPIVAILSVFVLAPLTIAFSRFIWRRAVAPPRPAVSDHAVQQRLENLQQAVDTIAIEVERISEGQRFVTKILSDRAIGAGPAEPAFVAKKSAISSDRG